MLLTIDSGNTNAVFAVYDGETRRGVWRASSDPRRTADEYAVWLTQLMALEGLTLKDITGAIIANVVPAARFSLRKLCNQYLGSEPLVIGEANVDLGIENRIDRPKSAGADRLVNAVAAHHLYGGPAIVIDFGTATNFDIVAADGAYEGGVIAPAAQHSVDALYRVAAQLPRVAIERPAKVIGKDTVPAMQSGIFWGYVGLIEGLVKRIKDEYGQEMKVIGTGGLAPIYAAATDAIEQVDQDLTLRGLTLIYRENQSL
ncbi:type III pantothenate kinase [Denitrobaculum tricleocarpae]|uniref:Type III pantothenate kinase n=1 Tax=Denitrobaculum tricleocarpae TaxID=2591009 RepID=A0A545TPL5_9PROT|nr:type III pantothenate kinase [Denitrobaculum tricleocarpae]TQV79111.1 type III pantothenate kinase [Denitrobaculum tricleocarpae]